MEVRDDHSGQTTSDREPMLNQPAAMTGLQDHSALNEFVYSPLDATRNVMRLLRILPNPGMLEAPVHCELRQATLMDGDYSCLSYAWGDTSARPAHMILLNGKRHYVHSNLARFLQSVSCAGLEDDLWIDAICIDQSNLSERNHQVQRMANIYRGAGKVIIWLGDLGCFTGDLPIGEPDNSNKRCHISHCAWCMKRDQPFWDGHKQLTSNQYWKRMWIVQEIALARTLVVWSSCKFIPWSRSLLVPSNHERETNAIQKLLGIIHLLRNGKMYPRISKLAFDLIDQECADRRDHVYGLIGVTRAPEGFKVDYSIDQHVLFLNFVQYLAVDVDNCFQFADFSKKMAAVLDVEALFLCSSCYPMFKTAKQQASRAEVSLVESECCQLATIWLSSKNRVANQGRLMRENSGDTGHNSRLSWFWHQYQSTRSTQPHETLSRCQSCRQDLCLVEAASSVNFHFQRLDPGTLQVNIRRWCFK